MLIILEGADLTGKTTLANRLSTLLQFPIVSPWIYLPQPRPSVTSVAKSLHQLFSHVHADMIYDRFFFSEYVYAQVLGRDYAYVANLIREWEGIPDVFLICLTASDEAIQLRYEGRGGDWFISLPQIAEVRNTYAELLKVMPSTIPVLPLDTSNISPNEVADTVVNWLNTQSIEKR